nr:zinc finger protein 121-like [Maniola hyperantus]
MVHKRVKHPSDFACPHCGYSLNSKAGLTQHFTKKHIFEDTQYLDGPLCEPCNIRFASERAYTLHMKVSPKHTPADERQRNYQPQNSSWIDCALCDIKLKGFKLYAKHFEAKHPDQPPPTRSKRKAYKYTSYKSKANDMCEVCGRCFVGPLNLREHMQQHTGVMMYQCDICDKTFMKKPSLRGHIMLKHTDPTSKHTDKFQCRVCCKVISTFGNLQRHMVVHQAVRPSYQCNVCGKSFTTNAAMQSHVAHVHHHVPWPKRVNRKRTRAKQNRIE